MRQLLTTISAVLLISNCCHADNEVFDLLLNRGVTIGPGQVVRLPPPTLADGLDATTQRRLIEAVDQGKHSWESLTRRAVVAPFVLKISENAERSPGAGRRVDVWFVAYGDLSKLGSDDFINSRLKPPASDAEANHDAFVKVLTEAELAKRKLSAAEGPEDSRYVSVRFTLLDRVQLAATIRNVKTETKDSIVLGSILDTRFAHDGEFPNTWSAIDRDDAGRRTVGKSETYSGFGAYAKATRLIEPRGAIFIEYHLAFAEPHGWFHGANLLRSKLPIVAQDAVRELRRELGKRR